jgi:hypothetical protein
VWIEVRVREAEIGFAEEMAFLARCRGVGYAREVQGVYALGLPARSAAKAYGQKRNLHALGPPLILAMKLDGKLNEWPDNGEAPRTLVSSKPCAESGTLEYLLHLL